MNEQQTYQPRQTPPPYIPRGGSQRVTPSNNWAQPNSLPNPQPRQEPLQQPQPQQAPPQGYPQYGASYPGQCRPWQPYHQEGQKPSNHIAIAGFVLSLISIFIGWIPLFGWLIWILGSVFSFIGLFSRPRGLAIAGVIISLVMIPMIVTILVAIDAFTTAMFLI